MGIILMLILAGALIVGLLSFLANGSIEEALGGFFVGAAGTFMLIFQLIVLALPFILGIWFFKLIFG